MLQFVRENNKETLPQVLTDARYKKDKELLSKKMIRILIK
jgi:hypothetical protein